MSLEFPNNRKELSDRMKNDVRAELGQNSNPFLRNSALGSLIFGMAGRIFDFFSQLKFLLLNMFPDTATGDFLVRWGSYVKIGKLAASNAAGTISIAGELQFPNPHFVPEGTPFQSSTQAQYISTAQSVVIQQIIPIQQLNRSGQEVTAKTNGAHPFAPGIIVDILGAIEGDYNGSFTIIRVPFADEFVYNITTAPPTPATGVIEARSILAQVPLESIDFGTSANLAAGESLALITPVVGVDNAGTVQFDGIVGGEDVESDELFRSRILDRYQNPVSFYNVAQITQKVKTLAGVTRVIVQEITPEPGDITVFFLKDNDDNIIPNESERVLAKKKIFEIKPAHVDGGDPEIPPSGSIILPPLGTLLITFAFTALDPNNASMQQAIINNLRQLFRGGNNIGEDMPAFVYECVIADSFDNTGQKIKSFTLNQPQGIISVGQDTIAILDKVTFNF